MEPFTQAFRRHVAAAIWAPIVLCAALGAHAETPEIRNIPFTVKRNIPLVEARIAGSGPLFFIIDTGADPSAIDLETARRLNLPVDESKVGEASGVGEDKGLAIMPSSIVGLVIDGQGYEPIDALAADLSAFSRALEIDLAGVLGYSFLKDRVVRIDYLSNEIAIADSHNALPPPSTDVTKRHRVPLKFNSSEDLIPVFEVTVNGSPLLVSLDTGKSGGIEVYKPATERLGLQKEATAGEEAQRLGARGASTVRKGQIETIRLGPFTVENMSASFSETVPTEGLREASVGNLFLRNFVLTVDYVEGRITFEQ